MSVTIAHYMSLKDIDKDEAMAILHTCGYQYKNDLLNKSVMIDFTN